MDPEKKDNSGEFGKVIDALHGKRKLPSLRTYQGDMAEFIKEKNQSVVSIAVKEKEKKEKEEEKELKMPNRSAGGKSFKTNVTIAALTILLLFGGAAVSYYAFKALQKEPVNQVVIEEKIIPYNNLVTLANITNENLGRELANIASGNGISIVKISGTGGQSFEKAKDLFTFLKISLPASLLRTMGDDYALGVVYQNEAASRFVVIKVNNFGIAFSAMLDWEKSMERDLAFLIEETYVATPAVNTTGTTTDALIGTTTAKIPLKQDVFAWRDIIIKNKDTRGLVNQRNEAKITYTFLDKNTILIAQSLSAIGDISTAYASRSFAR